MEEPLCSEHVFKEKRGIWAKGPYAGAKTSLYLIVKLRSPVFHPYDDHECFLNYSTMEQPIGKGRVRGRGRKGMGADFMPYNTVDI